LPAARKVELEQGFLREFARLRAESGEEKETETG
jgi:hypothetical protein